MNDVPDAGGLTVIIADDEAPARHRIAALLAGHTDFRVIRQCVTGPATVAAIRELGPDILFLDVQMPGLTGFEVLAALPADERPIVIFSTAYDEYALAAFDAHAVDYLLKPFADDRFYEALRRAEHALRVERIDEWRGRLQLLLAETPRPPAVRQAAAMTARYLDRFVVPKHERLAVIEAGRVDWIEAARDYVRLHTGSESHVLRAAIGDLARRLDPATFLRIHRSTIVQFRRIRELYVEAHGDYVAVLEGGARLRVSRRYRVETLRRLGMEW